MKGIFISFNEFNGSHFGQVFSEIQPFKVAEVFWNASTVGSRF